MNALYDPSTKHITLGKWSLLTLLGEGATSKVALGYDPAGKQYAAVKIFNEKSMKAVNEAKTEAQIQSSLKHPHILKSKEYYQNVTLTYEDGSSRDVTALVVEFAKEGNFLLLIEMFETISEKLARTYFRQMIDALEFLQKNQIAHRDIKPENIMLDADFCIKLADFGCSAKCSSKKNFYATVGTSKYFSPEQHAGKPYSGYAADLFATAMVFFSMVCGRMPFSKATEDDYLYSLISRGKTTLFWKTHDDITKKKGQNLNLSPEFKDLMNAMLEPNPEKRPNYAEIKTSAWYQGSVYRTSEISGVLKDLLSQDI